MSTTALMTFAEFEQLPDCPGKQELIDGELIQLPPPEFVHSLVAKWSYDLLLAAIEPHRVFSEVGFRIGGGWLQPDVSVLWPDQQIGERYLARGPMLAIEVLSPSNTAAQIDRKLTLYFSEGAGEVWVVNPRRRTMTVFRDSLRLPIEASYTSELLAVSVDLTQMPSIT